MYKSWNMDAYGSIQSRTGSFCSTRGCTIWIRYGLLGEHRGCPGMQGPPAAIICGAQANVLLSFEDVCGTVQ